MERPASDRWAQPQPAHEAPATTIAKLTAQIAAMDAELRELRYERSQWAGQVNWSAEQRAFSRAEHLLDFEPEDVRHAAFTGARYARLRQLLPAWVERFVAD